MSPSDTDPLLLAGRLVIVVVSLFVLVLGVRVAVSRRFPVAWVRVARLPASQRSQPVRIGGSQALLGASLLIQQAPFLIPMPYLVGRALFAVALLLLVVAVGWFVLRRD
ncbi:hypothetical protein GA0074696_0343 [Micromonospora purpureochromogenes]|uniref:Uncharacterized protein n=1 Tax=Micromonospora purpureochromogenes TaxID=47872 RepID=A0A1C4UFT4_9ACTN|nr:hypothetical protein [Micromonospora purpureochromogenes]SCE70555.1 hypothetical protein GA0074696_0343 [Micromonospora purpureochromogenes]